MAAAQSVRYEGHDAWQIRVRNPSGPTARGARRNPSELGVTMWIDRSTDTPLAIRWGDGEELWRIARVEDFHRYPDDAAHRAAAHAHSLGAYRWCRLSALPAGSVKNA